MIEILNEKEICDCGHRRPCYCDFKREKKMTDKIQMTYEQAYNMLIDIKTSPVKYVSEEVINNTIEIMKQKGYIQKSELQTLVEEAEEAIHEFTISEIGQSDNLILKIIDGFKALKKSHPEFKK